MSYTISAGVKIEQYSNARRSRIEAIPLPDVVTIPLDGAVPAVKPGDSVSIGQVIGDSSVCAVHASIPGYVTDVNSNYITIENNMTGNRFPVFPIQKKLSEVTPDEIISVIQSSGICAKETLSKIFNHISGRIDKIIINCCEEPPLSSIERLVIEHPASVVNGVKILLKVLGVRAAYFAIENNKTEAISRIYEAISGSRMISLKTVAPKYPLGDDRQLVYVLADRAVSPDRPVYDSGCAVFGAEICSAVYRAFAEGTPYNYRIITVGGDCVKKAKNIIVPLGTRLSDIVRFCGGLVRRPKYLIEGGAMTGESKESSNFYVSKKTEGILLLSEKAIAAKNSAATCVKCGKCVSHCPMHLMPLYIAEYSRIGDCRGAEKLNAESCTECGTCTYVCPAGIDIGSLIRMAKSEITAMKTKIQPKIEVNHE